MMIDECFKINGVPMEIYKNKYSCFTLKFDGKRKYTLLFGDLDGMSQFVKCVETNTPYTKFNGLVFKQVEKTKLVFFEEREVFVKPSRTIKIAVGDIAKFCEQLQAQITLVALKM